jgi:hypothetical protein
MSYEDLIAKLEAAPEGGRELDQQVAQSEGWVYAQVHSKLSVLDGRWLWHDDSGVLWDAYDGIVEPFPHYTTSLDAALSLVHQRGWDWTRHRSINGRMTMVVHTDQPLSRHGQGANDAIALLIAYFRAKLDYAALEAS